MDVSAQIIYLRSVYGGLRGQEHDLVGVWCLKDFKVHKHILCLLLLVLENRDVNTRL